MKVAIGNRQRRHRVEAKRIRRLAERTLNALGFIDSELSVTIVGDRSIRRLNRDYRGFDKPTNVLSFPMSAGDFSDVNPELLGDVVISADTAFREAEEQGISFFERLGFLLLHGILHVTGYDHERSGEAEAKRMERKQRQLYTLLKSEGFLSDTVINSSSLDIP
ncbi:MAG: rRNA maturation RNase YbeY [Deltaproteobacteria bacterium]|nr:rRNA maturation RNase YbeY [Deltaproteobacteria bacterium]